MVLNLEHTNYHTTIKPVLTRIKTEKSEYFQYIYVLWNVSFEFSNFGWKQQSSC